jgi:MSHA biogenesis protein MshP
VRRSLAALGTRAPRGARGFTLVSAIFLMVVLVILSVSLVTMSSVQHMTAAQQLQTVRATYAARTGVEWAVQQALTNCPVGPTTLAPGGTLSGFTVNVTCTETDHTLPNGTQKYYVVAVTATAGTYGGPDYVSRSIETKVLGPVP